MKLVNLGCGHRFHPDWINIDLNASSEHVLHQNLREGLTFETASVDVIYASHVLEHLSMTDGERLLKEIHRVLKEGGVLRIVVPDLEGIAKSYIESVGKVRNSEDPLNRENHKWAIIELIDQMVREQSGGEMGKFWHQAELINEANVAERVGHEFLQDRKQWLARPQTAQPVQAPSLKSRLAEKFLGISKEELNYLRFRRSAELHLWMYDEISLKRLMESTGFQKVHRTDAFHSEIPEWEKYVALDVEEGSTRKPDSLFMEARKYSVFSRLS